MQGCRVGREGCRVGREGCRVGREGCRGWSPHSQGVKYQLRGGGGGGETLREILFVLLFSAASRSCSRGRSGTSSKGRSGTSLFVLLFCFLLFQ